MVSNGVHQIMVGRKVGRKEKVLNSLKVKSINTIGKYADGRGLYLQVSKWKTKSWIFRYQINGRRREMGLGSIKDLSLSDARKQTKLNRQLLLQGIDPKIKRDADKHELHKRQIWTFSKCANAYIESHKHSWTNAKHENQWRNTLKSYAYPVLGDLPVEEINTSIVMRAIEPIWFSKTETASRVRSRIEKILSWAIARDYRDQPNPAIWRGNIKELLPSRSSIAKEKHHPALPYSEISQFISDLKTKTSISALALQFTILTATRTSEVLLANWDEIDLEQAVWTIPETRMKSNRLHRIPLSFQAINVLKKLPKLNEWLFPSPQLGKHLSNVAMLKVLKIQMQRPDLTVHGFRSTFRDWCAEVSNFPRELAESALAHVLSDKTEAAYQRGDLLEKRRVLMQEWANYVHQVHKLFDKNNNIDQLVS